MVIVDYNYVSPWHMGPRPMEGVDVCDNFEIRAWWALNGWEMETRGGGLYPSYVRDENRQFVEQQMIGHWQPVSWWHASWFGLPWAEQRNGPDAYQLAAESR